ncbi:MAG: DUF2812 domain-containing protein [Lachnospiraceae bacterium]|nr:DUF2812 domain-containing protein [Lachnospiraceae bacterium]
MKNTKTEIRFFSVADHEAEQEYLRQMHQTGWEIIHVGLPCFYHFKACSPEDMVYQLDYYQEGKFQREEYLKMFQDCGWEYLFDFMDYHYFRKPAAQMEGDEEIFCDDESRLNMLQRVFKGRILWLLIIFFITVMPNLIMIFTDFVSGKPSRGGILVMWIVLFAVYAVLLIRFALKYYAFKKKANR